MFSCYFPVVFFVVSSSAGFWKTRRCNDLECVEGNGTFSHSLCVNLVVIGGLICLAVKLYEWTGETVVFTCCCMS